MRRNVVKMKPPKERNRGPRRCMDAVEDLRAAGVKVENVGNRTRWKRFIVMSPESEKQKERPNKPCQP